VSQKAVAELTARYGIPLHVRIPYRGGGVSAEGVVAVARAAEDAGFTAGFVGDHIAWPRIDQSEYPPPYPNAAAGYPHTVDDLQLEPLTVLSYVLGATERLTVATGILVATYRPAVLLAKQLATMDYLAPGRVLVAFGTGWLVQEFEALGVPFRERGTRLEETTRILRHCWSDPSPEFHGKHWDFGPLHFNPQPGARIPIWFGGHSEVAWKRAARFGDGWLHSRTGDARLAPVLEVFERERPPELPPLHICMQQIGEPGREGELVDTVKRLQEDGAESVLLTTPFEDEEPDTLLRFIDAVAG
jgi:probable F420-dependent oxidoreductase